MSGKKQLRNEQKIYKKDTEKESSDVRIQIYVSVLPGCNPSLVKADQQWKFKSDTGKDGEDQRSGNITVATAHPKTSEQVL